MSRRYHRDISVAAPRLPQYFLVRILGLTPQAMYLSPLRGSGSHDNFLSGLDSPPGIDNWNKGIGVRVSSIEHRASSDVYNAGHRILSGNEAHIMSKTLIGCGLAVLGLVVLVALMVSGVYNNLVGLEEGVDAAWGQVENVYQRRADLIPNLVATVKGAADFEQETLQNVVEARAKVGQMNIEGAPTQAQMQSFQANQDALSSALSRLLVVVERYPELKAVQAFRDLQVQLEGTENRIAVERNRYNEAARRFNTARRRFPAVLIAGYLGFGEKGYFESKPGADEPPQVEF
jgi:LemA protein